MTSTRPAGRLRALGAATAVLGAAALTALASGTAAAATAASAAPTERPACAAPAASSVAPRATCFARYLAVGGSALAAGGGSKQALTPAGIQAAYDLPDAGAGRTVGIVDAYDNPKAESDLAKFRSKYGLPPCTTDNGCLRKVNQSGEAAPLPQKDSGWGLEIALDLDAVSSACPQCSILLVEGDDSSLASLGRAENTAVRLGADVVSNSYGADEFGGMQKLGAKYYVHPGVPILASTGDFGFTTASFPAVLTTTIAVGGTTLSADSGTSRGWTEKVWAGAGSGCSAYIDKPSWQSDPHCLYRTVGDVSADADPDTGLLVKDSFGFPGTVQVGGTSLSSPLIAAMYALAGDTSGVDDASGIYAHPENFNDVVSGRNGVCGGDYLCTGKPGYDAPSGVGTPNGVAGL